MRTLATKLGFDKRQFGPRARGAAIGLIFWFFIFAAALLNVLNHSDDYFSKLSGAYFAFSLLFFSAAFVLAAVADLLHGSAFGVALALRVVSILALLAAGVVFLVGGIYTTSGPENVAVIVGLLLMVGFGIPYLQWYRNKHQDKA